MHRFAQIIGGTPQVGEVFPVHFSSSGNTINSEIRLESNPYLFLILPPSLFYTLSL